MFKGLVDTSTTHLPHKHQTPSEKKPKTEAVWYLSRTSPEDDTHKSYFKVHFTCNLIQDN